MFRHNLTTLVVFAACLAIGATETVSVRAAGYWNMPGTVQQRKGHGYSGGYHAPFLLGPIRLDGWGAPNEVRLPCSPAPYCGYCAYGCECECGRMFEATSTLPGAVPTQVAPQSAEPARVIESAPVVEPAPSEVPADEVAPVEKSAGVLPVRPLFDAPVQR